MGCGMGVIKYLLFIFNFIFVLCGLAILVVGVLVQVGNQNYFKNSHLAEITGNLTAPSITLIVVGSIIFIIAFLGCCGAIRESHCMMVTFACLLLTILIVQVAVGIYVFVTVRNSADISFKDGYVMNIFNKYASGGEEKELVNTIQEGLHCCGIDRAQDFLDRGWDIPGSCCGKKQTEVCAPMNAYKNGCVNALEDLFKSALTILGGVALGIAVAELIGIIFALCLANSIKNSERRGYSV